MKGQQRLPFSEGEDVGKGRALPRSGQLQFDLGDTTASAPGNPQPQSPGIAPKRLMGQLPFDQGGAIGHGYPYKGGERNPTPEDWEQAGPSTSKAEHTAAGAATNVHSGQFQMFMTPREIRSKYQALDADRQDAVDPREGELTGRAQTTAGEPNYPIDTKRRERLANWHGGASQIEGYTHTRSGDMRMETDDELFGRKLEESQLSPGEYKEVHGGIGASVHEAPGWDTLAGRPSAPSEVRRQAEGNYDPRTGEGSGTWNDRNDEAQDYVARKQEEHYDAQDYGSSLYEKIRDQGVLNPVHLSYDQMGGFDKPEVVGGHHRLAAQEDIDPDAHIPVAHWRNIREAQSSGNYS